MKVNGKITKIIHVGFWFKNICKALYFVYFETYSLYKKNMLLISIKNVNIAKTINEEACIKNFRSYNQK